MTAKKILVVDDDATTAIVMQLYLRNFGFHVPTIAKSASEAISMAKAERPDLVLMDIRLGGGLDGIDAAEVIIERIGIPVVYVTAYSDEATLERAQLSNPVGFINKPLREKDLKTTLRFALTGNNKPQPKTVRNFNMVSMLRNIYDLTRAEARVVATLLNNPNVENAANTLHVSLSTVRTHLKHIYRKTGTKRQTALLHKIVTGPIPTIMGSPELPIQTED